MTKLTRYESFDDLKSSTNAVDKAVVNDLNKNSDLEEFIKLLVRNSSIKPQIQDPKA